MVNEEYERQIADLLGQISHELFIHSRRLVRSTGLTRPQLATIFTLLREGELSTGVLARRLSLSAPTLSGILDRLEGKGLVERRRGARDRRAVWVRTTAGARTRFDVTLSLLGPGFSERLARLSEEDKHRIVEALGSLAGLLGDSPRPPSEAPAALEASQEDEGAPAGAGPPSA